MFIQCDGGGGIKIIYDSMCNSYVHRTIILSEAVKQQWILPAIITPYSHQSFYEVSRDVETAVRNYNEPRYQLLSPSLCRLSSQELLLSS